MAEQTNWEGHTHDYPAELVGGFLVCRGCGHQQPPDPTFFEGVEIPEHLVEVIAAPADPGDAAAGAPVPRVPGV